MWKRAYRPISGAPRRITVPSVERPLKATITRKLLDDAMKGSTQDETKREDEKKRALEEIKYLLEHPGAL